MIRSYRDLVAWQKAMDLVTEIYAVSRGFPKEEIYGLTSQLRRASVSVPSNIAEGHGRPSRGEFVQFLGHAKGSLAEIETQVIIAQRLGFLAEPVSTALLERTAELGRILHGLVNSLKRRSPLSPDP